jgi:hypothetical protein
VCECALPAGGGLFVAQTSIDLAGISDLQGGDWPQQQSYRGAVSGRNHGPYLSEIARAVRYTPTPGIGVSSRVHVDDSQDFLVIKEERVQGGRELFFLNKGQGGRDSLTALEQQRNRQ